MTARTHDLAAITALAIVVLAQPLPTLTLSTVIAAILANQIGGIIPDIDQPTAPLWRNLPIGKVFGRAVDSLLGGHRFLTHSILGLALFGFLANRLLHFIHPLMPHVSVLPVWYAFLIGMVSHLLMDSLTKEGVPWLLPLPVKIGFPPGKALRITTGKHVETLVVLPLLIAVDIWLCAAHYTTWVHFIHGHILY
ncbi:MAG TPA: metal-dependent hydrolase [Candidatus Saccharimonadales bacterium]|nr:metal-dependent hydrolase [Candidatus Saccharimonadales bacterium]